MEADVSRTWMKLPGWFPLFGRSEPSGDFYVERMTVNGGWKPVAGPLDERPDREDFTGSGQYRVRCVRREQGKFAETCWTHRGRFAGRYYQEQRKKQKQEEWVQEVREQIEAAADQEGDDLDPLERTLVAKLAGEKGPGAALSELTALKAAKAGLCQECHERTAVTDTGLCRVCR